MALLSLQAAGHSLRTPVRAVIVADEEVGSPIGRAVVEAQLAGAAAVIGLEPPHSDGALKSSRLGSARLRLCVSGREAHAALDPARGVSAIDELLDQLEAIRALASTDASTLLNVGTIQGGSRTNVVAGHAEAKIGIRFASRETERATLDALEELKPRREGASIDVEMLSLRPAWPARSSRDPLLDLVVSAARSVGQQVAHRPAAGAGDTNLAGARGLPTLDGFGPRGWGAHAVDETIVVESLADRAALLGAILADRLDNTCPNQIMS